MIKRDLLLALAIAVPIVITQASWIFLDARKRKEKHYWLWGLFGLINAPQSLIVYLVVTRIIMDKSKKDKNKNPL
ncbi:sigmaY antisigma factor component [Clostridium swellfunianum]|uniref:sigmaY antisigma factor component n=1 Tax=Clostridium swellfunianum TaxID=1367462 RepID=UPI002030E914|nr:sigmaY antisigma factor component [Clostridium swellfunianum]MCM0648331.1 sigmaY antisigma factor component [Clostridium swellfunianum]